MILPAANSVTIYWSAVLQALKSVLRQDRLLTGATFLLLISLAVSLVGLAIDPRMITDAPAWLKPLKFSMSGAIYVATLAGLLSCLDQHRRPAVWFARLSTILLLLEVAGIDMQAARGVASHFNVATTFDRTVFGLMGVTIAVVWLAGFGILASLWREQFANPAWGWSLRLGMAISLLGAAGAFAMLHQTSEQKARVNAGLPARRYGAHTVGALDGGPGFPLTNWSLEHGDLRIPHFLGLHALQVLPLLGWWLSRLRSGGRLVFVASGSYLSLIAILAFQAVRSEALLRPSAATLGLGAAWAIGTAVALAVAVMSRPRPKASRAAA
jgi:hypothetical protein